MKIAIAGAGAMGGRFGFMLNRSGFDVTLIDQWQPHVEAVRKNGFKVTFNGKDFTEEIPMFFPEEVQDRKFDIIILYTKAMQLDTMLTALGPVLNDTFVACLLNGIGHETVVEKYVPRDHILLGNTMWSAGLVGPGQINLLGDGNVELQNLGEAGKDTAQKIVDIFTKAGLGGIYSEDVTTTIYKKACLNGVVNGLCALLETTMAGFGETTAAWDITHSIINEFSLIAEKEGAIIDKELLTELMADTYDPNTIGLHHPSMYQDLVLQKRLTEIDCINGYIAEKGKVYGIPTPYCQLITQLVHCKEEILGAR